MPTTICSELSKRGYVFLPNHQPGVHAVAVAMNLGLPLTPWEGGLVQTLIPRTEATPNTYSGIYGLNRFPFHTDLAHWCMPPRYLLLRCVTGYADVPTLLIDGWALMNAVTLDILGRAIFRPRRPRDGALALLRLCEPTDGGHRLRWDEAFLTPASKIGDLAKPRVQEWLAKREPMSISLTNTYDTLLIDNWRMLHARSPITAGREDRAIERVYLEGLN
jgi:L-asparagine oxygenase